MENDTAFGTWLRRRRKALDLTQKALAEAVGCSVVLIHKIEKEERRPSRQIAELLAAALQIPIDQQSAFIDAARGKPVKDNVAALAPIPTRKTSSAPPRIPMPPTALVGRQLEIGESIHLLTDEACRLLTVVGQGGIGKTRVVLEIARHFDTESGGEAGKTFPDGVFFLSLATVQNADQLVPIIADAVGLGFYSQVDHRLLLLDYLRDKPALLVLDNFEHMVEAACLIAELIAGTNVMKFLVTSRERLNIQGEWVFELRGLPYPNLDLASPEGNHLEFPPQEEYSAVALFSHRAKMHDHNFKIGDDNLLAVLKICQAVEGLPLGIELAASWIGTLSCEEIAQEVRQDIRFLETTARDIPVRHRSLQAVFDQSWALLSSEERLALQRLAVFQGGFERAAVISIATDHYRILQALMLKSLLHRTLQGRFDMHPMVHQFASTRLLDDPDDFQRTHDKHCSYYLGLVQQKETDLRSNRKKAALAELTVEMDNISAAWHWAIEQHRLSEIRKASSGLMWYFELRSLFPEGLELFSKTVEDIEKSSQDTGEFEPGLKICLDDLRTRKAYFELRLGMIPQGLSTLRNIQDSLSKDPDEMLLANVLSYQAFGYVVSGRYRQAEEASRKALELNRRQGNRWQEALGLLTLGNTLIEQGSYAEANLVLNEGLSLSRSLDDERLIIMGMSILGRAFLFLGCIDEARRLVEEGYHLASETGDYYALALALQRYGLTFETTGDLPRAADMYLQSIELYRKIGDTWGLIRVLNSLGRILVEQSELSAAREHFREALEKSHLAGATAISLESLLGLAAVSAAEGDLTHAQLHLQIVETHPRTSQETSLRAAALRAELASLPAWQVSEAASITLQQAIKDILAQP
jgi:predicted ATPase/DNA-binding XRE family transcriptional regulator